MNKIAVLQKI